MTAFLRHPSRLAAGLTAVFLAACQQPAVTEPPAAPPILQGKELRFAPGHPQLQQIAVTPATPSSPVVVDLPARLVWNEDRTQRVAPPFAGRVARIVADVGQPVRPGSVLAQLASPEFGAAQAETAKAQVDVVLQQKTLARQRELFEAGVLARKDLEQAEAESARARAEAQRAQARTALYGARGDAVNQSLALTAGIAGVVVERNLTPGQELRPDQAGNGVPPLFVVSDPTSLWVQIDAREAEAGTLRPGASFELLVPAYADQTFTGMVVAAADFIDPATRTIKIRGVVANPERKLKAEMLATARVRRSLGAGVMVPASAVALRDAKKSVIVQVQPGVFEMREVAVGWQGPQQVLVSRGLEAGEEVVSENMLLLSRQFLLAQEAAAPERSAREPGNSRAAPEPGDARAAMREMGAAQRQ